MTDAQKILIVNCPTCQTKVTWSPQVKFRPFCSQRCQLIDRGEWFSEQNIIPGQTIDRDDPFHSE